MPDLLPLGLPDVSGRFVPDFSVRHTRQTDTFAGSLTQGEYPMVLALWCRIYIYHILQLDVLYDT